MRIVSLLPSATEIIARLGLADALVGRSNECTYPPEVQHLPVVTAARIAPLELESVEIDRQVREAIKDGRSLYAVDAELIDRLKPDVIVTQDLCAVCAVSSGELASACPVGATVLSLDPSTLDEVAASIETLARALGVPERGSELAGEMHRSIDEVGRATAGLPRPRVFVAEWIDPPFVPGHWLPASDRGRGRRSSPGRARPAVALDELGRRRGRRSRAARHRAVRLRHRGGSATLSPPRPRAHRPERPSGGGRRRRLLLAPRPAPRRRRAPARPPAAPGRRAR